MGYYGEMKNMDEQKQGKMILVLSLLVLILLFITSYAGIFIPETYARNTQSFRAQGIGQDIVNLFIIIPLFLIATILYYKGNKRAILIWGGVLLYLIYSFVIYCLAQPFNFLFLVYCAILGLSFYSGLYFMLTMINKPIKSWYKGEIPVKLVSTFFIVVAILFYFVWLSEVIPASINNEVPQSVIENGVNTNPVHVLDLSILLPALLITAILLLKGHKFGYLLTPILLIFFILMTLAILGMVLAMSLEGVAADIGLTVIFLVITVISALIALVIFKPIKN